MRQVGRADSRFRALMAAQLNAAAGEKTNASATEDKEEEDVVEVDAKKVKSEIRTS